MAEKSTSPGIKVSQPKKREPPKNTKERIVKDVQAPIATPLAHNVLFNKKNESDPFKTINLSALQTHFIGEGRLNKKDVLEIVQKATEIFLEEPNIIDVASPITICGDIHGQYYDLVKLLEVGGNPADTSYLFLGDYVDRGSFSIECVLLLFSFKIMFPKTFTLIRGNHECRHLTQYFTFRSEVMTKYDEEVYDLIMDSFDALPLAAVLNKQFLCIHGGLSPDIQTLEDIRLIDRFCEPPQNSDLLWADPMDPFTADKKEFFEFNEVRGCSYSFSYRAVCAFLQRNNLLSVIRAHEAQDQGYRMMLKNDATGFPTVITLFSAPNYLDAYNNKGAVMRYENNVMNIRQFNCSPHPYWLPNFMDVFTWSIPFVSEKIAEIVLTMLNLCDDEKEEAEEQRTVDEKEKQRERLRKKILGVSKMMRMYSILREERETLLKIKTFTPENKIPSGLLSKGVEAIRGALGDFEKAKSADKINEKRPPIEEEMTKSSPVNQRLHFMRQQSKDLLIKQQQNQAKS